MVKRVMASAQARREALESAGFEAHGHGDDDNFPKSEGFKGGLPRRVGIRFARP